MSLAEHIQRLQTESIRQERNARKNLDRPKIKRRRRRKEKETWLDHVAGILLTRDFWESRL